MTSENESVMWQSDFKKAIDKLIHRPGCGQEKELLQNLKENKAVGRFKPQKNVAKNMESRKTIIDERIKDVFFNSEYFRHQSNNKSSLSFCSGDNGENRWTINSSFDAASQKKAQKMRVNPEKAKYDSDEIDQESDLFLGKAKSQGYSLKKKSNEKTQQFLEGILSGRGRVERDLITLITEQMFLAERELQITRTHLIETISKLNERDLEIIQLHEKLQNYQKMGTSVKNEDLDYESKTVEDYKRLVLASEKLKKQVNDMEEFLNDYGLVWVGDKESNQKPDFDKIIKNFQKLNSIAAQPKIIQTSLGAKFELPRDISVALYSNGMLLHGNDFREYKKLTTELFLQDLEDGYFPAELQPDYPEGVPFEVADKRNEVYETVPIGHFKGKGNRLGSIFENKPASVVFLEPTKESKYRGSDSLDKVSTKKNVNKKRNKICDEEIKNYLLNFTYGKWDKESLDNSGLETTKNEKHFTLRIRYGKGNTESFRVDACANDRLSKFHESLQRKLCERYQNETYHVDSNSNFSHTDFEVHIYGKSPFRLFDNLHKQLKDFDIVENCVVNLTKI